MTRFDPKRWSWSRIFCRPAEAYSVQTTTPPVPTTAARMASDACKRARRKFRRAMATIRKLRAKAMSAPERLDGVDMGGLPCGIDSGNEPKTDGNQCGDGNHSHVNEKRKVLPARDELCAADA